MKHLFKLAALSLIGVVIACNAALGVVVTGTSSFFGLTSGTSGGVPYFSSNTTAASSGLLAAGGIMLGGGSGAAPTTSACTIDTNLNLACSSTTSGEPEIVLTQGTADTSGSFLVAQKVRNGSAVTSGDTLFTLLSQGFANAAYRNAAQIIMSVAAAPSGNNVPSKIFLNVTDAAGTASAGATLDNKVHLSFVSSGVPTLTSCGGGSPTVTAGSTDIAGEVTEGTSIAGCVMSFKTAYTSAPFCVVGMETQLAAFSFSVSNTAITVTNTSGSGNKFQYVCHGL